MSGGGGGWGEVWARRDREVYSELIFVGKIQSKLLSSETVAKMPSLGGLIGRSAIV